jgi:tripartite-type tricarboxylate transporter receptor subunit TctC
MFCVRQAIRHIERVTGMKQLFLKIFLGLSALGALSGAGAAEGIFPDRPIHWIVPWPAGGGADVTARIVADKLGKNLGVPVVIENRGGAGGNIGAYVGAQAKPDGYTIIFAYSGTHSINPWIYKEMPFKQSDFAPVVFMASVPALLVVNDKVPVKNVKELMALAREKSGQMKFGSSGNGSINHLAGELFQSMANVQMLHVPYKGGGPAAMAVIAGEVDMVFAEPATVLGAVKVGQVRAIALTNQRGSSGFAGVPTINDSGVAGYDVTSWNGVLAPAGTPAPVIARLNAAFNQTLADPEVKERLLQQGYETVGGKPEDFSRHIDAELAKWGAVVQKIGLQVN